MTFLKVILTYIFLILIGLIILYRFQELKYDTITNDRTLTEKERTDIVSKLYSGGVVDTSNIQYGVIEISNSSYKLYMAYKKAIPFESASDTIVVLHD
jgi:hypothetical protein